MQLSAGLSAHSDRPGRGWARRLPSLIESLGVVAAIVLLLPGFARLADVGAGRDQRFAEQSAQVRGLPPPVVPAVCESVGALVETGLAARLCRGIAVAADDATAAQVPVPLTDALTRTTHAFNEPLQQAQARLAELQLRQREGIGDVRSLSDDIASLEEEIQPLLRRFQLTSGGEPGPLPLVCATQRVRSALGAGELAVMPRANAVLLLAAALDGDPATPALAATAVLPVGAAANTGCSETNLPADLSATSSLMAGARQSVLNSRKNEAVRVLYRSAGWQWSGAMLLGLLLAKWSRHGVRPATGAAVTLALWAAAAWAARLPWPFSGPRSFEPARADTGWGSAPAWFVLVLAGAALLLWLWPTPRRAGARAAPQAPSSRLGYPGLVLATGLGWLLLLDLSAHAHAGNRYLALYHQGHLWLAMLVFSLLLFLRQDVARGLAWTLSAVGEACRGVQRRLGAGRSLAAAGAVTLLAVVLLGLVLANMRQLTSEFGRIWLIVGAAWFFFLRGDPLAERLAHAGRVGPSALRYLAPLLFVIGVLAAFMVVTRDMGPLLIAAYAAGAFLAASVAMWWHLRSGQRWSASALALALFVLWIAATTLLLFQLGGAEPVTAARLESLAAPLASGNDQLALVSWFQQATPPGGFGIGNVPWCGFSTAGSCGGVPAQIHSDYSFTAIVGVFGSAAAWAASLLGAWWLHRLVRHHGRVTRGEPRLLQSRGRLVHEGQAFLSWVALAWVVLTLCQLAVTVAGNLAVLPLTGVTFPFVSFGMTSLVVNMAFLALCLNVDLAPRSDHG